MNQVNYNDLKTLWYCVRFQSFSAAARALNKTESTVSSAMKRLSEQSGYQLFVQAGHGDRPMKPTRKAVFLAKLIEPVIRELEKSPKLSATAYPEICQKGISVERARQKGQFSLSGPSPDDALQNL